MHLRRRICFIDLYEVPFQDYTINSNMLFISAI